MIYKYRVLRLLKKKIKKRLKKVVVMLEKGCKFAPAKGNTQVLNEAKVHWMIVVEALR